MDCIFCKIIQREIPAKIVFENERLLAFNDAHPQAPIHQLIIPKQHIATLNDVSMDNIALLGEMMLCAQLLAKKQNIAHQGYRTVLNCNSAGGQVVYHLHLHLLGGRSLSWPPG